MSEEDKISKKVYMLKVLSSLNGLYLDDVDNTSQIPNAMLIK